MSCSTFALQIVAAPVKRAGWLPAQERPLLVHAERVDTKCSSVGCWVFVLHYSSGMQDPHKVKLEDVVRWPYGRAVDKVSQWALRKTKQPPSTHSNVAFIGLA